jgi:MFS family permease
MAMRAAADSGRAGRRPGVAAGSLLSAGVLALMAAIQPEEDFLEWGWRVPFLLSALLVVVGWYIRNRVSESPMFEKRWSRRKCRRSCRQWKCSANGRWRSCSAPGLRVGENISYYILTVFSLTYLVDVAAETRSTALERAARSPRRCNFSRSRSLAWLCPTASGGGRSMRSAGWALRPISLSSFRCWRAATPCVDRACSSSSGWCCTARCTVPQAAFITELFPTRIRYSGVSIAYQLTSIVAGSLAPIIALWLYTKYQSATPVMIYVGIACAISGVTALLARETKGIELADIR